MPGLWGLSLLVACFTKINILGKFELMKTPLDVPILLFLGIATVATLTAIYPYASKILSLPLSSILLMAVIFVMITALIFTYSRSASIGFSGAMIALGPILS